VTELPGPAVAEHVRMPVDGPFSLAAAAAFGFGPTTGRPSPDGAAVMRLAFVTDDLRHQAGALIRQEPGGGLAADVSGPGDVAAVERQLRRILSVDRPADGWVAAGRRDPVLGRLQAEQPGLRPVLFHSPYEAAAWAVMSQRRHRSQAAAVRRRLCEALGRSFELDGEVGLAFPLPDRLLGLDTFPGLEPPRIERLRGVAERALAGDLDPEMLASMETDQAMTALRTIPGLGPFYAGLVLLRASGVSDALSLEEPRLRGYLRHYYGLPAEPDDAVVRRIAEPWRPFRTWAAVLIRASGDRDGLPRRQAGGADGAG
jgi:DNA-3-methyladenine glycosylase II